MTAREVQGQAKEQVILSQSGIMVVQHNRNRTVLLDPSRASDNCDFTFVSHAHVDHLHRRCGSSSNNNSKTKKTRPYVLASKETLLIAKARGYEIADASATAATKAKEVKEEEHDGFTLIDTGHILGSRGLLIGDSDIYYTGDISTRERAFMKPAKVPHVRTLIIESTFGRPEYIFPSLPEITHKTNRIISEMYDLGIPVILMGYSLGKAQLLTRLFSHWDPIYLHESVAKMNAVYTQLGIQLKSAITHLEAEQMGLLAKNRPWIMVAPLMHAQSTFVQEMKKKYGAVTVAFTGWAVNRHYKFMRGLDHAMPLSDHCDYSELVDAVRQCSPDKVYTFHGFAAEFAQSLRKMGFDAEPVLAGDDRTKRTRIIQNSTGEVTLDSFW